MNAIVKNDSKEMIGQIIIGRDDQVQKDYADEIENICLQNDIKYFERKDEFAVDTKYSIAVSWRWLIDAEKSQLIVLHDSLLPKYRGFAPLVSMLINQEEKIGVTALFATEDYDRGEIITQSSTPIIYPITIEKAIEKVSENYTKIVLEILGLIKEGKDICGTPQNEEDATYCLWRDDEDYLIDWKKSSTHIERFVNAVGYPYNGAATYLDHTKYRILEVEQYDDVFIENRTPGKLVFLKDSHPVIVCGKGLLLLKNVTDDHTGENVLPFKKFRIRLKNNNENSL